MSCLGILFVISCLLCRFDLIYYLCICVLVLLTTVSLVNHKSLYVPDFFHGYGFFLHYRITLSFLGFSLLPFLLPALSICGLQPACL